MSITEKKPRRNRMDELNAILVDLANKSSLDSWNSFIDKLNIPADMYPAFATARPELMKLVTPRDLTTDECSKLYKIIGVLLETNWALRSHAEQTAHLVDIWADSFKALEGLGKQIQMFANFRHKDVVRGDDITD